MEARKKQVAYTSFDKNYINGIKWDFLFFKSLGVIMSIIIVGLLGYMLWL